MLLMNNHPAGLMIFFIETKVPRGKLPAETHEAQFIQLEHQHVFKAKTRTLRALPWGTLSILISFPEGIKNLLAKAPGTLGIEQYYPCHILLLFYPQGLLTVGNNFLACGQEAQELKMRDLITRAGSAVNWSNFWWSYAVPGNVTIFN